MLTISVSVVREIRVIFLCQDIHGMPEVVDLRYGRFRETDNLIRIAVRHLCDIDRNDYES